MLKTPDEVLLGTEGALNFLRSFFGYEIWNNRTMALHGSIRGAVQVTYLSDDGVALIHVTASDTLGFQSVSHEPPRVTRLLTFGLLGNGVSYANNYLIRDNYFGPRGVGSNVNVNYDIYTIFR